MKKNRITHCPACHSHAKAKSIGPYCVCSQCRMMYLSQIPDESTHNKHIEEEGMWIINDKTVGEVSDACKNRLQVLRMLIASKSSILDVGCGNGQFVYLAKSKGYTVIAMDVSQNIVTFIKKNVNIPAYNSLHKIRRKFDAVTAFDVIEHTTVPSAFIDEISKKLQPQGILMLTTPNARGISARILGRKWWVFGPKAHFNLFTPHALRILLEERGFAILEVTTDTLTQWFPQKKNIAEKLVNKVVYSLFTPLRSIFYAQLLGDNIEILAQKL